MTMITTKPSLLTTMLASACLLVACSHERVQAAEQLADPGPQVEVADDDLLAKIVAAQQGVSHVQGRFRQSTTSLEAPDQAPNEYLVQFKFRLPDCYFLQSSPVSDPEEKEWFISDGKEQVNAEQIMAGVDPIVSRKPVDRDASVFQRVGDFFSMDLEALRKDFTVVARLPADSEADGSAAVVELKPIGGRLAEDVRTITVFLDAKYRTQAVVIDDQQDNRLRIAVEEADYTTEIPDAAFTWP